MKNLNQELENHYLKENLFEDIINRLTEKGIDLNNVKRDDIAGVDEFHVRGAAVSKELANAIELNNLHVLDVGCGLGGPCRLLADEYNCISTGIDLSHEFIRTAIELSKLVKLDNKTSFIQADATNIPLEDNKFDIVWTQHVQMNIPDKQKLYAEIKRVLKPGGHFLYYDIFKNKNSEVSYPMPWASHSNQSFLFTIKDMEKILNDLGFSKIQSKNQTQAGIDFFESLMIKIQKFGPPKLGINVLMGASTKPKLMNLLAHFKSDQLTLQSGIYKL